MTLNKNLFGEGFVWGVSTAAVQIEGAASEEGKSKSIWDEFSVHKGNIKTNETPEKACDFYHLYKQDIALIKKLGFNNFRFSISWSRIFPDGFGYMNKSGIDYYNKVIDTCLESGITPWITLYHWDLPQALQNKGGWTNREILLWFSEYVNICANKFGDRVKNWMVLNEPLAFTSLGYLFGMHAPGMKGFKHFFPAVHHAALCQSLAGKILRDNVINANIGTTFSCAPIYANNENHKHHEAVKRYDAFVNRLFIEPALGLGYPINDLPLLKHVEKYLKNGDENKLAFDFDFIGIQNYTRYVVKENVLIPYLHGLRVPPKKLSNEITDMKWEIYPDGLYKILKQFSEYKGVKKIIITENGAAFNDVVDKGYIHDNLRIKYFNDYLAQVLKAKNEGVNVAGYFVWSLLDNFEWAEGYKPRFGLVYVDFKTQNRILKDSANWFADFLK
ncbi:MAG: beta-glucosidase [Bacteroidetes bacterium RIFCSPLOWO2_12_FULL_31_6]|nr:MAG: beta-glucosidase [Bacteroidetes bacterium RIFCSPLOWO2_12_FULL_31_6]